MTVSLVNNSAATMAQQSLSRANEKVQTATVRISSGQRVFNAEEDAAALAVGSRLKVDMAAYRSAQINAGTAMSMLQISEGAVSQVSDIVVRMKALAIQASSGQLATSERSILDGEYQSLMAEIERIVADTELNGTQLVAGQSLFTQSEAHSMSANGISTVSYNNDSISSSQAYRYSYDSTTETLTLSTISGGTTSTQSRVITGLLDSYANPAGSNLSGTDSVKVTFADLGIDLTLDANFDRSSDISVGITDNSGADIGITNLSVIPASTSLTSEGVQSLTSLASGYNSTTGNLTLDINTDGANVTLGGIAGLRFGVDGGAAGADGAGTASLVSGVTKTVEVYVTTANGYEQVGQISFDALSTSGTTNGTLVMNVGEGLFEQTATANGAPSRFTFDLGAGADASQDFITIDIDAMSLTYLGIEGTDINEVVAANDASVKLDSAMASINSALAKLGAAQSRIEFASANLKMTFENSEVARSTLLDADISEEMTELAQNQALVEMSVNMLSQANMRPRQLLKLLEG